jgi:hypothetical protein
MMVVLKHISVPPLLSYWRTSYELTRDLMGHDSGFMGRSPELRGWHLLKPHCIRCCHFKVDDVSGLEAISKPPVRIVEDNVAASLH